jgi:hypothetical protein
MGCRCRFETEYSPLSFRQDDTEGKVLVGSVQVLARDSKTRVNASHKARCGVDVEEKIL